MTPRRPSLRRRLAVMLALAAAATFGLAGVVMYQGLAGHLREGDHDRLRQRAGADAGAEVRTELRGGEPMDVLRLPAGELTQEAGARRQRLDAYRRVLLAAGGAGVLTVTLLGARMLRSRLRELERLSADARRAPWGVRLSPAQVDAELVGLVDALNETRDQLDQAHGRSEGFCADVAHELRSPLATLIGGMQVMLSAPRSASELREALASNLEELEQLKILVNDMLFLARADHGERAQELACADLAELADATLEYCQALADDAGARLLRRGAASAVCNAGLMRRAMANLVSNAIRHAGGERRVELHVEATPDRVRVWVFNTGEPLPDDVRARMFDRFFRAGPAHADRGERHGLGLAIVQAIARMHGGGAFAAAEAGGNAVGLEIPGALATAQHRVPEPEPKLTQM